MANRVYIKLEEVKQLDFNMKETGDSYIRAIIGIDGMCCELTTISNQEEINELSDSDHVMDLINTELSDLELENIMIVLMHTKGYYLDDKFIKVKRN